METGLAVAKHNHCKDYFGVDIDVRRSDVQKALRRGLFPQAVSSFFAGFNLRSLFPESSVALAVQTNFINRLAVIAVEDVGFANPCLVRSLLPVLHAMATRKAERDPRLLAAIIRLLADSPKSRLCSHLACAYRSETRSLAEQFGLVFAETATLKTPDCFTWLETTDPVLLFSTIRSCALCLPFAEDFALLQRMHAKASTRFSKPAFLRYTLGLAHYLCVESEQGRFVTAEMQRAAEALEPFSDSLVVPLCMHDASVFLAPLGDSVDVHTRAGRASGSGSSLRKRFRLVGAEVQNAHALMNDAVLESIYIH